MRRLPKRLAALAFATTGASGPTGSSAATAIFRCGASGAGGADVETTEIEGSYLFDTGSGRVTIR